MIIIVVLVAAAIVGGYAYLGTSGTASTTTTTSSSSTTTSTSTVSPVTLHYGDLPYFDSQQAAVIYGGKLNQSGINLQVVRGFGASSQIFQGLASGTIDMGVAAVTPPAIKLMQQGIIKILAVGATTTGGYNASRAWGLVVSPKAWSEGVRTLTDLQAPRTIADAAVGTTGEVDIAIYAQRTGLNFSNFKFVHISSPQGLLSAALSGQVDAVIFSLPYPLQAAAQGAHLIAWDTDLLAPGQGMPVSDLYVTTAFYNAHPDTVKAFLALWLDYAKSYNTYWLNATTDPNKGLMAQWTAKFIGGSINSTTILNQNPWPYIDPSCASSIGVLNTIQTILYNGKLLTNSTSVQGWFIPNVTPTVP